MASPEIQIPDSVYPPIPGENHRYYGNIHKKQVMLHSTTNVRDFCDTSSFPRYFDNDVMDIHEAAACGNIDRVKELLDPRGAGETTSSFLLANEVSSSGLTPLHYAASRGHTDIVQWLVTDAGAIIDLEDQTGETALLKASYNGHVSIVAWLLKSSANVEQKDNDGWTALHNASSQGHLLIVKYLLENSNANVDVKSNKGHTPLMNAASKGHIIVVKYLLNTGNANPFIKNCLGESAYDIAATSQKVYICEVLEKAEREWLKNKRLLQSNCSLRYDTNCNCMHTNGHTVTLNTTLLTSFFSTATSFNDPMDLPAANQPYDVYAFHNTVPIILHENQRLSSTFSLSIRNPPRYSASNLLKADYSPWTLHPEGKPSSKDDVRLPLGHSSSSISSKSSQSDWFWFCDWIVDFSYPRVDSQGWQYSRKFEDPDTLWSEALPSNSNTGVRRRRWVRIMKRIVKIDNVDALQLAESLVQKHQGNGKAMRLINNYTQLTESQGTNSHDNPTAPSMLKPLSPTSSDATITNHGTPSTASFETIEHPWNGEDVSNLQEPILDLTAPSTSVSMSRTQTGIDMTNSQNKYKWENDEDVSECRLCNKKFRLWTRRHHCRRCGQVVCDQCSTGRVVMSPTQVVSGPSLNENIGQHSQPH
ncbi:8724_t:CDS:2, partial [Cetraspora pellucida]